MQKITLTMIFMRKLFFGALALVMGAFTFVSCDDNDKIDNDVKGREKGTYLSMTDQQQLYSEAFIKSGEQVEFEGLAEAVRNIIYSFAGGPLRVDQAYEQMREDPEAARKMSELKKMENLTGFNLDDLYFGVDLVLIDLDTIMLAEVQQINHNVDRFIINITSKGHTLNSSLKVSASQTGAIELTEMVDTARSTETINIPSVVNFAIKLDGEKLIGADVTISTDYLISVLRKMGEDEEFKMESLTLNGSRLAMDGSLYLGGCSFGGKVSYDATAGIKIGASVKSNNFEIMGVDVNVKATLENNLNYASAGPLMGLVMNGITGMSANARLGGDAIVYKAEFSKNPISVIMPILSAEPQEMPVLIDSLNAAFSFGAYFKGYKEPQAKFRFAYQAVDEADIIPLEGEQEIASMIVVSIKNSGLTMVVDTYDADGKEITVPAKEYFGKIDVAQFAQGMTDKFNASFAETLAPLFGVETEDFDLTDLLKMLIFNYISAQDHGEEILIEG